MVGTLNYMAPEQLLETEEGSRSAKVGKWADTWSLGCILYLMAYGKLPYQEFKSTHMKIAKITSESHQIEFRHGFNFYFSEPLILHVLIFIYKNYN